MEFAEHRTLLFLVGLHAAKNVVQNTDSSNNVRALVEHNAFGALTHIPPSFTGEAKRRREARSEIGSGRTSVLVS